VGRVWCEVSFGTYLAGLSALLHKDKCIYVVLSCVACCAGFASRCWLSSAVGHGAFGGEGLVPRLVTDAGERVFSNSYFFCFVFDVSLMGQSA
jgi:hypothetical protein